MKKAVGRELEQLVQLMELASKLYEVPDKLTEKSVYTRAVLREGSMFTLSCFIVTNTLYKGNSSTEK